MKEQQTLVDSLVCIQCGHRKTLAELVRSSRNSLGVRSLCKACYNERYRETFRRWRKAHRAHFRTAVAAAHERHRQAYMRGEVVIPAEKRCACCELIRKSYQFYEAPAERDGLSSWCIRCSRASEHYRRKGQYPEFMNDD